MTIFKDDAMCSDKELLIGYLYGECDPSDRRRMDAHLAICPACQAELYGLQNTQEQLATWGTPESALGLKLVRTGELEQKPDNVVRPSRWMNRLRPVAALAAAAVLVLAIATAVARVEIRYGADGVTVRTGWSPRDTVQSATTAPAVPAAATPEWRTELAALERRMRDELARVSTAQPAAPVNVATDSRDAELLRRVRAIVQDSEQKQDRELALRITQAVREIDAQRQSDLFRIQQSLGRADMTAAEVARQRDMLNYVVRVSSQQPQR